MMRFIIFAILLNACYSIKNPCKKNSDIEFHSHPTSDKSFIQCTKRGEMFLKECPDSSIWNDEDKKCSQTKEKSQVKTLAAKFKIKKLSEKKNATIEIVKSNLNETNIIEENSKTENSTTHSVILKNEHNLLNVTENDLISEKNKIINTLTKENENLKSKVTEQNDEAQAQIQSLNDDLIKIKQEINMQNNLTKKVQFLENYFQKMMIQKYLMHYKPNNHTSINLPTKPVTQHNIDQNSIHQDNMQHQIKKLNSLNKINSVSNIQNQFNNQAIRKNQIDQHTAQLLKNIQTKNLLFQNNLKNRLI